jgi:FdhD protein
VEEQPMGALYKRRRIRRFYEKGKARDMEDDIIRENRLLIRLDGKDFVQAVVSPTLLEEFILGFLVTRHIIDTPGDIISLEVKKDTASVLRHPDRRGALPELKLLESTGSRNVALERRPPFAKSRMTSSLRVTAKILIKGMRKLSRMPLYKRTGGTHCAILFSQSGEPLGGSPL